MDAKYQSILPGGPLTGREKFVNTPKFQAQEGTAYTIEAGTVGSFTPRVDWTYASKPNNYEINSETQATPAGSYFNDHVTMRQAAMRSAFMEIGRETGRDSVFTQVTIIVAAGS